MTAVENFSSQASGVIDSYGIVTADGGVTTIGSGAGISVEGENQLEFYSTLMFRQGSVIDDDIFVVGIAGGYDDALYLVEEIAKEVYEKTGDLDIRSYIREREREEE